MWAAKPRLGDILVEFIDVLASKGELSSDERVEDDAHAPHIHFGSWVLDPLDHFWGHVARRTTEGVQQTVFLVEVGEAKVRDFDVVVLVNEKVFGLQVSVGDGVLGKEEKTDEEV